MNRQLSTILLVRHALSKANVDLREYEATPDHAVPLARPRADPAARRAGRLIARLSLEPSAVCSWHSPYLRCKQTQEIVLKAAFSADARVIERRESFLLREQEFGDWEGLSDPQQVLDDPAAGARRQKLESHRGKFYFRHPGGESAADVAQRVAVFIGKLHRSHFRHHIVFLHGVTQRAFRLVWLHRAAAWFQDERNPANASVLALRRDPAGRWGETYLRR